MEKRKAHYSLDEIKRVFSSPDRVRLTYTALQTASELDFGRVEIWEVVQKLEYRNLYKSMTSHADHRIWRDVYHADYRGNRLYVKFTIDSDGYLVISFKKR